MRNWFRIIGILMILGSTVCFWNFNAKMSEVRRAKADRENFAMVGGLSTNPNALAKYEAALAKESQHRLSATNWFLTGGGVVLAGLGIVGASWLVPKRALMAIPAAKAQS